MQNGMRDARTHVNRQKSHNGIEPPRTVREQLDELVTEIDGQRRRDPVRAAELQHVERDNGVGGAWIDRSQRVNRYEDEVYFEKLPDRHAKRAERRQLER
jgi:hypothetical protein